MAGQTRAVPAAPVVLLTGLHSVAGDISLKPQEVQAHVDLSALRLAVPARTAADVLTREPLGLAEGKLRFSLPGRRIRLIEVTP